MRRVLGACAAALAVVAVVWTAGCERPQNAYVPPPPPEVTVAKAVRREVQDYWHFTGTTAAKEAVEIQPRVSGFVQEIHFAPDSRVQEGQLLFTIDTRPFEAAMAAPLPRSRPGRRTSSSRR